MNLLRYTFLLLLTCTYSSVFAQSTPPGWEWRRWIDLNSTIIAADKNDNLYVCGQITEDAFPPTVGNSMALHITKYDRNGNFVWVKGFGYGDLFVKDMKLDDEGNIYLQGTYFGSGYLGDVSFNYIYPGLDVFTAKIDEWGNIEWVKTQSAAGGFNDNYASLGLDGNGNTYTAGLYYGDLDLGTVQLSSGVDGDLYLVKYDEAGNTSWAKSYEMYPSTKINTVLTTADADGNSFILGRYDDSIKLGNTTLYDLPVGNGAAYGTFIAKHNADGDLIWTKNLKGISPIFITADNKGNVYATGYATDSADVGAGPIYTGSGGLGFLAGFDKDGQTFISAPIRFTQMPSWYAGSTIATDNNSNVYVGGFFEDHGTLAKFHAGNMSWSFVDTLKLDETYQGGIRSICTSPSGTVYTMSNWYSSFGEPKSSFIGKLGLFPAEVKDITPASAQLRLYPNPASGSLTVISNNKPDGIQVYDISGKMVYNNTTINTQRATIDIRHLVPGVYLLRTGTNGSSAVFTKQ